jgi:phospholipid/cholesterol/gamma-HCH transport system substrate-binding protein
LQSKVETHVGIFVLVALGIFMYMGFQIGAFRFDRGNYSQYTLFFKDISGLGRKAEVKIAGVKVGWVEKISLHANNVLEAEADIMVQKDFVLHQNAYAMVRQDGLLGPKYIELVVGDPLLPRIEHGGVLTEPAVAPVNMDELLQKFKKIATNVESVTESLSGAIGGPQGEDQLKSIFDNFNNAAEKLASFSDVLERSFSRNEGHIDTFLEIGENIRRVADKLEKDVLPSFQESIEKVSESFDRDFGRVADQLTATAQALEEASLQARDGFSHITSVTSKIDEGKGLIGKLINEDETYRDLKVTMEGLKNYFAKINTLQIIFDGHGESMHRPAEHYRYEDSKFYFDMRIYPDEDKFYMIELASSERGWRQQQERYFEYSDQKTGQPIDPDDLKLQDRDRLRMVYNRKDVLVTRNRMMFGFQFGKIYKDIALRFGLFENTGGLALDIDIPFRTDKFRWVTSLEAFDLAGWNRIDDRRPHLKWLNRMYFMRNIYFTFGADDFVSKHNASCFFGAGVRFGDDDVKYLLPVAGGVAGVAG